MTTTTLLTALEGRVIDAETGRLQPCWVTLETETGEHLGDWKVSDRWTGFPCNGEFRIACPPGRMRVRLRRFLTHLETRDEFAIEPGETVQRTWTLRAWVNPARLHFVAGDSHNHINDPQTPEKTVDYCRALGVDYLNLCQGWMWNASVRGRCSGDALAARLEAASTPDMRLHFGAERPKTRYGHAWWINLKPFADPFGEYMSWHDPAYVEFVERHPAWPEDVQTESPLKNELPFTTWRRYRKDGGAWAAAHPTSWWLLRSGDEQIITNITTETPFALLSGEGPDALAVMGYDPDQIFYQNLWFHLLNEGYLLAGVGETDGCLCGHHHIGQIMTYTRLEPGQPYGPRALAAAVKDARSLMTSGPFIRFELNGGAHRMGDKVRLDGTPHTLNIEAWSAPDPDEALSWIVVYRNGAVFHTRDLRGTDTRHIAFDLPLPADDTYCWYVVKAYGRQAPQDPAWIDVFGYVALCEREAHDEYRFLPQVALTNPIWFLPPGWQPPAPISCALKARVVDEHGAPLAGALVRARDGERVLFEQRTGPDGALAASHVPATTELDIEAPGRPPVTRSIFLDYRPVNACMEWCYNGRFRKAMPHLQPGQVPWSAFKFHELKRALAAIDWTLVVPR
ncbi:MAG TPA: CehA/McbA family metallohydrolase [Kiritimatiellia bacterium]|nr:CehA/McbA family metallohydrolase [Kiritimatiellia bacterium]